MDYTDFRMKFNNEWGAFRRYISMHPLTGFWIGVSVGVVVGALVRGML